MSGDYQWDPNDHLEFDHGANYDDAKELRGMF
jgi:hypothetical protein